MFDSPWPCCASFVTYTWFRACFVRNQGRNSCCFQSQLKTSYVTFTMYSNKWEFTFYKFVVVVVIVIVCLFLFFLFFFYFHFKFHFLSTSRGSLFSNLLLCKIIDMACCIAMVFMSMTISFVVLFGIFNCLSNILIEGLCVFAIAPAVMTSTGSTFHPLLLMLLRRGWDFLVS